MTRPWPSTMSFLITATVGTAIHAQVPSFDAEDLQAEASALQSQSINTERGPRCSRCIEFTAES